MEPTADNLQHLANFLSQTLVPDPAARKQAEVQLTHAKVQQGYPVLLLRLVVTNEIQPEIRLQGAIQFKNLVNQHWVASETHDYHLSEDDKAAVKREIVAAMLTVPEKLQPFLSEALSHISNADFPLDKKWPELLPQLMQSLDSQDPAVVIATLKTTHAIARKYRTSSHTDELWAEIAMMLSQTHERLLRTHTNCIAMVQQQAANKQVLDMIFQTLELIARLFYDLNYQDIPEVFEDNLDLWMAGFHQMLTLPDPIKALFAAQDEEKLSSMHQMQRAICEAIHLYADKYIVIVDDGNRSSRVDERPVFEKHLPTFVEDVWALLTHLGVVPQLDKLAISAIGFLSSVLKGTHYQFFQPAHLQSIVNDVVVPGLLIRESDEEDFEDNPLEYMQRDLEGGVTDTRRGVTCGLVNAMCVHFEAPVSQLCMAEIEKLLAQYQADSSKWKAKDSAIYLFIALAVKAETKGAGVVSTNVNLDVASFFQRHVLTDLQTVTAANVSKNPILMADLLKFLITFRNQLPKEALGVLFPILNVLLASADCIVHTYAACCVERLLTVKDGVVPRVGRVDLQPMLQPFLTSLFNCLAHEASKENPHIMKCIMRIVSVAQADVGAVAQMLVQKLSEILSDLCKDFAQNIAPKNPAFHHFIFETLAAVIKHVCGGGDSAAVVAMEGMMIPPFQTVLQQEITEFQPYFVQIIAQLLERRASPIPDLYIQILPSLLQQPLWATKSNQPALTRLVKAYISQAAVTIVGNETLFHQILGLIQFLMMSKMTDHYAFGILNAIICFVPPAKFPEFLPVLTNTALERFQKLPPASNGKFLRCMIVFFSLYMAKHGPDMLLDQMEGVQAGLLEQFLTHVWAPKLVDVVHDSTDKKICQVGMSRLLCECPRAFQFGCWNAAMDAVCKILRDGKNAGIISTEEDLDFDFVVSYNNSSFMALHNAAQDKASLDPLSDVPDAAAFVIQKLQQASVQAPHLAPHIQALAQTYQLS
mmetsp:Transcript_53150/g.108402  ORF Transcript_53150/g.108402 Transcript_53150/m.108402 type:complete len:986 (-) Transcript_53150:196-3153(-)|eukprot:CAMPEP_0181291368 /NCGR_PEP_ID=MMETSP1101-20121128/1929_1 /TAXON_ID=46948 /ORGANISM="Rhodomonas abbreviata, Strain Caron Lab Isolate" /LENGTH=985 /DNA_ID=CAMNT_0023395753 /DNA_START=246 /DNA_END=3203 /DNA_ORIENTATION=-